LLADNARPLIGDRWSQLPAALIKAVTRFLPILHDGALACRELNFHWFRVSHHLDYFHGTVSYSTRSTRKLPVMPGPENIKVTGFKLKLCSDPTPGSKDDGDNPIIENPLHIWPDMKKWKHVQRLWLDLCYPEAYNHSDRLDKVLPFLGNLTWLHTENVTEFDSGLHLERATKLKVWISNDDMFLSKQFEHLPASIRHVDVRRANPYEVWSAAQLAKAAPRLHTLRVPRLSPDKLAEMSMAGMSTLERLHADSLSDRHNPLALAERTDDVMEASFSRLIGLHELKISTSQERLGYPHVGAIASLPALKTLVLRTGAEEPEFDAVGFSAGPHLLRLLNKGLEVLQMNPGDHVVRVMWRVHSEAAKVNCLRSLRLHGIRCNGASINGVFLDKMPALTELEVLYNKTTAETRANARVCERYLLICFDTLCMPLLTTLRVDPGLLGISGATLSGDRLMFLLHVSFPNLKHVSLYAPIAWEPKALRAFKQLETLELTLNRKLSAVDIVSLDFLTDGKCGSPNLVSFTFSCQTLATGMSLDLRYIHGHRVSVKEFRRTVVVPYHAGEPSITVLLHTCLYGHRAEGSVLKLADRPGEEEDEEATEDEASSSDEEAEEYEEEDDEAEGDEAA
jgi:hypothetical protein